MSRLRTIDYEAKCKVQDCEKSVCSSGVCNMHYLRFWRHGHYERVNKSWGGDSFDRSTYNRLWRQKRGIGTIKEMHKKRFGGLREFILKRDGYKCLMCGMTNEEHRAAWDRNLTINHIDHMGRFSEIPNNEPDNLETLCLRCHGHKDAIQHGRYSKYRVQSN